MNEINLDGMIQNLGIPPQIFCWENPFYHYSYNYQIRILNMLDGENIISFVQSDLYSMRSKIVPDEHYIHWLMGEMTEDLKKTLKDE